MSKDIYTIKRELKEVFDTLMELTNPTSASESSSEFKERKIRCAEAAARVMQGRE
jgi:hypothetical protein